MRGGTDVPVIVPNCELLIELFGLPNCVWFQMLQVAIHESLVVIRHSPIAHF
jgi:hypothetical protein